MASWSVLLLLRLLFCERLAWRASAKQGETIGMPVHLLFQIFRLQVIHVTFVECGIGKILPEGPCG
jgi:hypothetical protein